jgi:succinoglycan biosynthesis transport protein ExoP
MYAVLVNRGTAGVSVELQEYLRVIRRGWRLIVSTLLITMSLVALLTATTTPKYEATAQLFVSTPGGNTSDLLQGSSFTQRQVKTYADLMTTPVVLEPVIRDLKLETSPSSLAGRIAATVPADTVLIDVSVMDNDPELAATLANAVGIQFTRTIEDLESVGGVSPVKATLVQPAAAPSSPVSPSPLRNMLLAVVVGLLAGLGLAIVREFVDTRVTTDRDVARVTDATVIGGIGFDKDATKHPLIVQADPHSARAEAFRTLRTNLQFVDAAERPRTLVFTSSLPGEGKTTTTANLALTLAASGSSVIAVEGDLRRPRLLEYMGLEGSIGLTNVLIGEAEIDDVTQSFGDSLTVLGAGTIPPNPSELLGSQAMAHLLAYLEERFDYVIIDAPPLLPVTDAAVLAKLADGAIIVVGSKIIKREQLDRALQNLENVDAHVLGVVMNRLPISGPDAYTYYTDGYRPTSTEAPTRKSRRAAEDNQRAGLLSRRTT